MMSLIIYHPNITSSTERSKDMYNILAHNEHTQNETGIGRRMYKEVVKYIVQIECTHLYTIRHWSCLVMLSDRLSVDMENLYYV